MPPLHLVNQYSDREIIDAYLDCRKHKSSAMSSLKFKANFERQLICLLDEINDGSYRIGRSRAFVVTWPKIREVWAACFRDRIVHHLICRSIVPHYQARFIEDTFACIPGRGTLAASLRVEQFCRKITQNWSRPAWALQVDIANFFVSISRSTLWDLLAVEMGEDSLTSRLTKMVVFHDPTQNAEVKRGTDFSIVPPHKSLWKCRKGYGLPIGNLTSQFFANFYLDDFDHYVKHELKARYYARYVDDALFLSTDKDQLVYWLGAINAWLQENRCLRLHPNKVHIAPVHNGIDFVGRRILPFRSLTRAMTIGSARKAVERLRKDPLDDKAVASVNSYLGMMRHADAFNTRRKLCSMAALPATIGHDRACTKVYHI